jgi:hypothetical protein
MFCLDDDIQTLDKYAPLKMTSGLIRQIRKFQAMY